MNRSPIKVQRINTKETLISDLKKEQIYSVNVVISVFRWRCVNHCVVAQCCLNVMAV